MTAGRQQPKFRRKRAKQHNTNRGKAYQGESRSRRNEIRRRIEEKDSE